MTILIRCCCDPVLVLGEVRLRWCPKVGERVLLPRPLQVKWNPEAERRAFGPSDDVILEAGTFYQGYPWDGKRRQVLALMSRDVPIARLRQCAGFVEINERRDIDGRRV